MPTPYFVDGVSLGPGRCKVIVKFVFDDDPEFEDIPEDDDTPANNAVLSWSLDRGVTGVKVDYPITRLALGPGPDIEVFAAGRLGLIGRIRNDRVVDETIDGPDDHGFIRDLRAIGHHLYAAGMGRQVYRRLGDGRWVRFDEGVLNNPSHFLDVTGLNGIDGLADDEIYAAGFNGEIWHCFKGRWERIDSPTNLILECVRVVTSDQVYVCGQAGTLFRGHGPAWDSIEHAETEDDFWGMEWFRDKLYLTTREDLFQLVDDLRLEPIDLNVEGPRTFGRLHAALGALWSFGPEHIFWTEDGNRWNEVVMQ
jgi:hypothetical protein